MKIAVLKLGAMGDLLLTTPFLRQLRKQNPDSEIHLYTSRQFKEIIESNPNVDKVLTFDGNIFYKKRFIKMLTLAKRIRNKNYDKGYILDKHPIFGFIFFMANIPNRIGFVRKFNPFLHESVHYNNVRHEIKYYLDLLDKPNYADLNLEFIPIRSKSILKRSNKNKIVLCPGGARNIGIGNDSIRRWSVTNFEELANNLKKYDLYSVGTKKDPKINGTIDLRGKTNLSDLYSIFKNSDVVITNDSGLMHLAAAANSKIVSLFGPSHPKRKAPLTAGSSYLWKDNKIYDCDYDLFGKKPLSTNINKIKIKEVLNKIAT